MTAYVNDEQKKEGAYGKAVKATLAATLAAGMVPAAAAFADEPAEAAEGNDVEVLAVYPENSFKNGKVTAAKDNEKNVIADLSKASFVADGEAHYIVPTEFTPDQGKAVDITDAAKYAVKYYALDADGKKVGTAIDASTIIKPGKYGVTVVDESTKWESNIAATFTIESASLKDATIIENGDVKDSELVYTGAALDLGLALNGKALTEGDDYSVEYHAKDSSTVLPASDVKNAGDYVAIVKGAEDGIYKGQSVTLSFSIAKLDLAKAEIKLAALPEGPAVGMPMTIESIKGFAGEISAAAKAEIATVPDTIYGKGQGVYTVKVAAVDAKNVTGAQTVEVVKTLNADAKVLYDGKAVQDILTDYSTEKPVVFDAKKLAAYTASDKLIENAKVNVVVREKNADGAIVENADLTKPGVWFVEVSVDAASTNYEYSGAASTFTVTVKDGSVDTFKDVYVKYEGEVVAGKTLTYTGKNLFENVSVLVKSGDKTLVEGKDYKVELLKKNDEGEFVAADAMVDAGEYKVAVSSKNYPFSDEVYFTVNPLTIQSKDLRIDPAQFLRGDAKAREIAYTGKAIVPCIQYKTTDAEGNETWVALPETAYELSYKYTSDVTGVPTKDVEEVKAIGGYFVNVADVAKDANFDIKAATELGGKFVVTDKKLFSDVPNTEWFYEYVYNAQEAKYMFGIGNSDIFAPNQTTSRAMAAQVLARMAGAKDGVETGMSFSDVAADAWYADAVAWASATGVVAGYPGTGEFRPENNVTRAEFCVMMQRYAKATMQGVELAEGEADEILAKYADGAAVADWAKEAVAWAVKNEIFGGYSLLNPAGDITRAEMAKMTTEFQAAPLTK